MERYRPARWKNGKMLEGGRRVENPKIDAFLAEIEEVCKKHGFHISHEDGQGAFEIVNYEVGSWIDAAHDCTDEV